ncbi:hypothetical protein MAM1_0088d04813 [Mucor ambiguus]|uniref:Uncharacterized protein n=1 Tax=Mucor ambiguus TaxID=91626 RepID=A0A0C9MTF7_9FUNG|nr:hypothetical protein MAM1_0088d04813 [Mucor ambiguus]
MMITARYTTPHFLDSNGNSKPNSCRRFTLNEKTSWTTDESGDETTAKHFYDKDKFIELAQAALEEAKMEEEQKGVLQELVEALLARTGAPMVANVILEQFQSQDVIERLAEDHFEQQERRRSSSCHQQQEEEEQEQQLNTLKEPASEIVEKEIDTSNITGTLDPRYTNTTADYIMTISEYLWRIFRFLLLASLVGLVYHFMCADPENQPLFH